MNVYKLPILKELFIMQKSLNFFSNLLIKIFGLVSNTCCAGFWGEPDYPQELLK